MTALLRIVYTLSLVGAWVRSTARRRFTLAGLAVSGALLVTMVMGVDTEHNVDYQAFTLLLALVLQALLLAPLFRARFRAERVLPRFATAGSPLVYKIRLRNLSDRTQKGLVLLENIFGYWPTFEEWRAAYEGQQKRFRSFRFSQVQRSPGFGTAELRETPLETSLTARGEAEVKAQIVPQRRGVLRFRRTTVARPDPLGLFRAFSNVSNPQRVLVLPKRYRVPPLALPGTLKYQQGGVAMASHVGQSEDFVALRDYRRGDPVRHIHWRSWAKVGRPVVKEFEDEFFVRHALVLDTFGQAAYSDVFEEAVSVAASFACTVVTQESLLDLLFVGPESYVFTAGRGLAHADQILEVLAAVKPCHSQPFQALEGLVLRHSDRVSGCICVFISWDRQRQELIRKLLGSGVPVRVLVIVPPGEGKTLEPGPLQLAPEQFQVLEAGQVEQQLAEIKA